MENSRTDSFAQPLDRHDIHVAMEQLLEVYEQSAKIQETTARFQLNEEINVALLVRLSPYDGTKHADVSCTMRFSQSQNLLTSSPELIERGMH